MKRKVRVKLLYYLVSETETSKPNNLNKFKNVKATCLLRKVKPQTVCKNCHLYSIRWILLRDISRRCAFHMLYVASRKEAEAAALWNVHCFILSHSESLHVFLMRSPTLNLCISLLCVPSPPPPLLLYNWNINWVRPSQSHPSRKHLAFRNEISEPDAEHRLIVLTPADSKILSLSLPVFVSGWRSRAGNRK
jgi:hypothetical protein